MHFGNGPTPQERAVRHVEARSCGPAVDPGLRITLNFHPDRLIREVPILGRWPRTVRTARSSSPAPATAASPLTPAATAGAERAGSSARRTTPRLLANDPCTAD